MHLGCGSRCDLLPVQGEGLRAGDQVMVAFGFCGSESASAGLWKVHQSVDWVMTLKFGMAWRKK